MPVKLIHFYETGEHRLFNLKADIAETKNLAAAKPELASTLAKRHADYLSEVGAEVPKQIRTTIPTMSLGEQAEAKAVNRAKPSQSVA
jgi:hypothetical protein